MAEAIRKDLISARDATNAAVPYSAIAAELPLVRSYAGPSGPPLALLAVESRTPPDTTETWISLAGTCAVQWPLPDIPAVLA